MTGKNRRYMWLTALVVLVLAMLVCTAACADDEELLELIPGEWISTDEIESETGEIREVNMTAVYDENGELSLRVEGTDGQYLFSFAGTWTFELVTDGMDRLTLYFSFTDNPEYADSGYSVEGVYNVYSESWVENSTLNTWLLIEDAAENADSPFLNAFGYDGAAFRREEGPNMRIANCNDYVSLRKKADKSSGRLAKVPLGTPVLAYPDEEQNGFVLCVYGDQYGYILAEYLEPIDGVTEAPGETEETAADGE